MSIEQAKQILAQAAANIASVSKEKILEAVRVVSQIHRA